jgi:outer membrane protein TolC
MTTRLYLFIVFVCFTDVVGFAQQRLALTAAIDTALVRNRDLAKLALSLQSELLSRDSAGADFAVTVRPSGSASRSDQRTFSDYGLDAIRKFAWGTELTLGGRAQDYGLDDSAVSKRDSVRVEVSQPLFRYAGPLVQLNNLVHAESRIAAARRNIELKKTDLVLQVVQTYVEILRLGRQLDAERKSLVRSQGLLKLTRAREAQGRVSRVDTLRVDLQRGQAESRVEIAQKQLVSAQLDFAELLGTEPGATYELEQMADMMMNPPSAEIATQIALSNRLDYAQVVRDCQDAGRGVRVSRRYLLPDVRLVTKYERFGQGATSSDASDLNNNSWFVGLQAASDLPMRKEQISYRQSVVSEQSAREDVDISAIFIRKQVQQELLSFDRAKSEATIAEQNLAAADSRVRLARRLFELGRSDNFSVTDAEEAYRKAENDCLAAKAESSVAAYRLLRVLGTLIEYPEELKPKPIGV